jgi:hypothetical protein
MQFTTPKNSKWTSVPDLNYKHHENNYCFNIALASCMGMIPFRHMKSEFAESFDTVEDMLNYYALLPP